MVRTFWIWIKHLVPRWCGGAWRVLSKLIGSTSPKLEYAIPNVSLKGPRFQDFPLFLPSNLHLHLAIIRWWLSAGLPGRSLLCLAKTRTVHHSTFFSVLGGNVSLATSPRFKPWRAEPPGPFRKPGFIVKPPAFRPIIAEHDITM